VKDPNLVLREKELDIVRVRKEVEALHLAIPLLVEDRDWVEHGLAAPPPSQSKGAQLTPIVPPSAALERL
jgi:hypothetical protein